MTIRATAGSWLYLPVLFYSLVTADRTYNADDQILVEETNTMDPIAQWEMLGDSVSDGVIAWIRIGIDTTNDATTTAAAAYYAAGGIANEDAGMGGGDGGSAPPSGTGAPTS